MDIEGTFDSIYTDMKNDEYGNVRQKVDAIASSTDEIFVLLKCASLLKTVDDDDGCQDILDRVITTASNIRGGRLTIAIPLRNLGRPADAYDLIKDEEDTDRMLSEKARTLLMADEGESALSKMRKMSSMTPSDRILLAEILCSLGEFKEAYEISDALAKDDGSYDTLANLCSTLILMGRNKDAVKTAKQRLKDDKTSADAPALVAYVMRVNGKTTAAAAYAHRALSTDHTHKGALETMAFCLIERSRFKEAKVMAGAINEKSPGDPAAIRILDACRQASK